MKKLLKKLLSCAMAMTMTLGVLTATGTAFAEQTENDVKLDVSKSKQATNLDSSFESRVTLSLPSAEYRGDLDVVFVLDGSTSTDKGNLAGSAAGLLDQLAGMQNLTVKAALVIFGGSVPVLYGKGSKLEIISGTAGNEYLTSLKKELTNGEYGKVAGRSGSNLQAGVKEAQRILDADIAVASSDKYMILLTDGGARMWVNEKGDAMSQGFRQNDAESVSWGQQQDFTSRYIEESDPMSPRTFADVWSAGNTDSNSNFAKYAMTQAQAEQSGAWKNAADWGTVCKGGYYPSLEVATYYAAKSIIAAGKSAQVIWVDYPYHDGKYAEYTNSFKSWLANNGYITRYDSTETTTTTTTTTTASSAIQTASIEQSVAVALKATSANVTFAANNVNSTGETGTSSIGIFEKVKDQLVQVVAAGSKVIDYMGYVENDYNMDFINDIGKLELTVNGSALNKTKISNNSYGFGKNEDGSDSYRYVLTYTRGTAAGDEYFTWEIKEAITKDMKVQLTYSVKLTNPKSASGTYGTYDAYGTNNFSGLYTNNQSVLTPVDSNGEKRPEEEFAKPTVSYTVRSGGKSYPTPTPHSGGSSSGNTYSWCTYPTPTPVPVAVVLPKTGDMTILQQILGLFGLEY